MAKIEIDKCPICSSQEENITNLIIPLIRTLKVKKNTVLFEQESNLDGLYLILKGKIKISKISNLGKEVVLEFLGPGKTFGEASLLGQSANSNLITTSENSEIYFIPKKDFEGIVKENPELYYAVVASLIRWMDRLHSIIETIGVSTAKERVVKYITNLQKDQSSINVQLTDKKHEVAMMLGLRPETFSRTLAELEQEGYLKLNHRQISVIRPLDDIA